MSEMRKCEIPDCQRQVPMGKLMCGTHWKMVPETERKGQYRAYRGLLRGDAGADPERWLAMGQPWLYEGARA